MNHREQFTHVISAASIAMSELSMITALDAFFEKLSNNKGTTDLRHDARILTIKFFTLAFLREDLNKDNDFAQAIETILDGVKQNMGSPGPRTISDDALKNAKAYLTQKVNEAVDNLSKIENKSPEDIKTMEY